MRNYIIIVLMLLGLTFPGTSVVLADLNNGLVAYYPFNGNANDESGNGNNGTVNGATLTTDRFGKSNSAYSFDGVNDYIDVGSGFNLDAFTLDAWVFIDPATNIGERRVISKDNVNLSGDRKLFTLKTSSPFTSGKYGHPAFGVAIAPYHSIPMGDSHLDSIEAPSALTAGWHHIAGVRNTAAGRFELYVDGLLVASKTPSVFGSIDSEVHTVIGQVSPIYNGEFFNGLIDEVRIYNRALSESEILELYNEGSTPTAPTTTTKSATNVKSNSATLNGTVNANGGTTTAWFEYGATSGTYSSTTSTQTISSGWSDTSVTTDISGLSSKTTYYYRLVAQNSVGTTLGSELSFATTAPPTVTTGSATNVTMISATLNGTVNANGTSTTACFEYGKTSGAYDKTTTTQSVSGSSDTSVSIYVSGLSSGIGYYYRLVAQNNAGVSYGSENSFTTITSSTPVPTPTPTPNNGLVAYYPFNGNANDESGNGNNGTVYGATLTTDRLGNANSAYSFDGVDDYIVTTDVTNGFSQGTVALWFMVNNWSPGKDGLYLWAATQELPFGSTSYDGMNLGAHPYFFSDSQILFGICASNWNWASSGIVPTTGEWYHLAGVWGKNGIKIYVNGAFKGNNSYLGSAPTFTNYNLIGSSSWPDSFMDGIIDDVRIYNRALSASEIEDLYKEDTIPTTPTPTTSPAPTLPPLPTPQVSPSPVQGGVVLGFVYDEDEDPMSGVTVTIVGANGRSPLLFLLVVFPAIPR